MQATSRRTVAAPVDHVWDVLSDHEGMSEWGPGMSVQLYRPGADDPGGVGAVRKINVPLAPVITEEVTAYEPGVRLAYRAIGGIPLKNYAGEVVLESAGSGTTISYTITADQRIPLIENLVVKAIAAGLMSALVRRVNATT